MAISVNPCGRGCGHASKAAPPPPPPPHVLHADTNTAHFNSPIGHNLNGSSFQVLESCNLMAWKIPFDDSAFILSLRKTIVDCTLVKAKFVNSRSIKGARAAVYKSAMNHHAYYSLNKSKSIWYDDQSTDLQISLLFEEKEWALSFQSYLAMWHTNNPLFVKGAVIVGMMEVITAEQDELSLVLLSDYVPADSESPLQSLEDFPACNASLDSSLTAISTSDPVAQFQGIESSSVFTFQRPYRCHMKDKAVLDDNKFDPNNILSGSQTVHNYFDGMQTLDPITGQPNLPLLAIKPLEVVQEEYVGEPPMKRQRLEIEAEFRSEEVANTVSFKDGSTKVSNVVWKTYIHVDNAKICQECLNWKYKKTKKKWKEADKTDKRMLRLG